MGAASSRVWGESVGPLPLGGRPIRVGISGAGPAGLCIAGILAHEAPGRFEIEVFERDSRERDQGSGWDIDSNGRTVLRRAGLDPASISRPGETSFRIYKTNSADPFLVMGLPPPLDRLHAGDPETNRNAMREGLLASLGSAAKVTFKCGVYDVRKNEKGGATYYGSEGQVLGEYDIVIDSSGVASQIRKRRIPGTETKDFYTGLTTIGGIIQDPETELDPELVARLGQGTLMTLGEANDSKGGMWLLLQRFGCVTEDHRAQFSIMCARKGMTDLCTELGVTASSRATSDTDQKENVEKIKKWMKVQMGDKWDEMYLQCVDRMQNVQIRPLFMFDPNKQPDMSSDLPFICVGDALHPLPPFTGSGGNSALKDAGEVGTFLVRYALGKEQAGLLAGLRKVELKCFQRAAGVVTGWGDSTNKSLISLYQKPNITDKYTISVMVQGESGWTFLKCLAYVFLLFYMRWHKINNFGLPKKVKAKSV